MSVALYAPTLPDVFALADQFDTLPYDDWAALAPVIGRLVMQSHWLLGDWLRAGEQRFGQMYAQAESLTGLDYSTLRTAKWLAGVFPVSRRRDTLSWSHHREIASLPIDEQERILDDAVDQIALAGVPPSTRDLRDAARATRQADPVRQQLQQLHDDIVAAASRIVHGVADARSALLDIEGMMQAARRQVLSVNEWSS